MSKYLAKKQKRRINSNRRHKAMRAKHAVSSSGLLSSKGRKTIERETWTSSITSQTQRLGELSPKEATPISNITNREQDTKTEKKKIPAKTNTGARPTASEPNSKEFRFLLPSVFLDLPSFLKMEQRLRSKMLGLPLILTEMGKMKKDAGARSGGGMKGQELAPQRGGLKEESWAQQGVRRGCAGDVRCVLPACCEPGTRWTRDDSENWGWAASRGEENRVLVEC
ncbi:hypothetical protein ACLOJK_031580 [Asimina triloba]